MINDTIEITIDVESTPSHSFPCTTLHMVLSHAERRAIRKPLGSRAVRRHLSHLCYMGVITWDQFGFRWSEMGRGLRESPPMWRGIKWRR